MGSTRAFVAAVALVAAASTLPYLPMLGHDFVIDDAVYIAKNPAVTTGAPLAAYFTDRATGASRVDFRTWYRPLRTLAYRGIVVACGLRPAAFAAVDLALYVAAVALVAALLLVLVGDRRAALLGTALWAFAPAHVEPVLYASALGDDLSLVFELAALYLAVRAVADARRAAIAGAASVVLAALAMGAKESALTAGGLVAVGAACAWPRLDGAQRRRALALVGGYAVLTLAFVVGYARVIGHLGQGRVTGGGLGHAVAAAPLYLGAYLRILVLPLGHAAAYADVRVTSGHLALAWLAVALVAAAAWRARRPLVAGALGAFVVALIPVLHLVPISATYADRYGLVASVALAVLAAAALASLPARAHRGGLAVAAAVAALYLAGSAVEARAWRNDLTLWDAAVAAEPRAGLARSNLGMALLHAGRPAEALTQFAASAALDGESPDVRLGSAAAYELLGRNDEAEAAARGAVAADPSDARAHALLGALEARRGAVADAAAEAARARTLNPDLATAWTLTAHLAERDGRRADAVAAWRRAVALAPGNAAYRAELARVARAAAATTATPPAPK